MKSRLRKPHSIQFVALVALFAVPFLSSIVAFQVSRRRPSFQTTGMGVHHHQYCRHSESPSRQASILSSTSSNTQPDKSLQQRLVLVGGGHAHVQVIKALRDRNPDELHVTLIDGQETAWYSGMVPGCISGQYTMKDPTLPLRPLAEQWAHMDFVHDTVVDIDFDAKIVYVSGKNDTATSYPFDVISLDLGSTARGVDHIPGVKEYAIPTRPIANLVRRLEHETQRLQGQSSGVADTPQVVVVGGGVAGLELAMSVAGRWKSLQPNITVLDSSSNPKLMPHESDLIRSKLQSLLEERNITVRHQCQVQQITENYVQVDQQDGETSQEYQLPYTHCIWATGAAAHSLAFGLGRDRGLAVEERTGWIKVGPTLQSLSHPFVFAAGDCCTIVDPNSERPPPKAGVYAVRAGPVLLPNLLKQLEYETSFQAQDASSENLDKEKPSEFGLDISAVGNPQDAVKDDGLQAYKPQSDFLKLLVCGDGTAIGFRFGIPIHGKWVMQLKDHIDRKFMDLFNVPKLLAELEQQGNQQKPSSYKKIAQYDADTMERPPRKSAEDAAQYLQRTDDGVEYMDAWNILKDMADDEGYRDQVVAIVSGRSHSALFDEGEFVKEAA